MRTHVIIILLAVFGINACQPQNNTLHNQIDSIAESYVKLQLKIGQYDAYYVDAYYGPEEWKPIETSSDEQTKIPADTLLQQVDLLLAELNKINTIQLDEIWKQRRNFLVKHLESSRARIELLSGIDMTFDEESQRLYDAIAPSYSLAILRKELENADKFEVVNLTENSEKFMVDNDKLDTLIQVTITELKKRTASFITLSECDSIRVELVDSKPWGAYNWYQGNAQSLIQINTDRPTYVNHLIDFLSHEIYPGHHLHLSTLDIKYAQKRGWVEFTVYPLYSPLSLIAEGIAESAGDIVFPEDERIKFEKEVLMPIAGIDTNGYFSYTQRQKQISLSTDLIRLEISRMYADNKLSRKEAVKMLEDELSFTTERANQALDFVDAYGSYIINYSVGKDIIGKYIDTQRQGENTAKNNWNVFEKIITTPMVPSDLLTVDIKN